MHRKTNSLKQLVFLSAVIFSLYLMATLPISTAQSISTTINLNIFGPDGATRLLPNALQIVAPSSMVNKQIKVQDKSQAQDFTDMRVVVSINPQPGFIIGDVFLIPCTDEKFQLQDTTDCIRSVQRNQKPPIKFSTFVDYQANWLDMSNAKAVGEQNYGEQEARLLSLVNIEIKGKRQWFGYWDVIKRGSLSDFTVIQGNDLESADLVLSDPKILNLTTAFIEKTQTIPKGWISKVVLGKVKGQSAQISTVHLLGLDQTDAPEKFAVQKTDRTNVIDTSTVSKEFGLVFPGTVNIGANSITIAPKPQATCGNDAIDADAGETRQNCCRDFPDGCGDADLICGVDRANKNDPGLCINKTQTAVIAHFDETEFLSCERRHPIKVGFEIFNMPVGSQVQEVRVELNTKLRQEKPRSFLIAGCERLTDINTQNNCWTDAASNLKDILLCERIEDKNKKDLCIKEVDKAKSEPKPKGYPKQAVPLTGCKSAGGRTECDFKLDRLKSCREGVFDIKNNNLFVNVKLSDQKTIELKTDLEDLSVSQETKSINEITRNTKVQFEKIFTDLEDGIQDAKKLLDECVDIIKSSILLGYVTASIAALGAIVQIVAVGASILQSARSGDGKTTDGGGGTGGSGGIPVGASSASGSANSGLHQIRYRADDGSIRTATSNLAPVRAHSDGSASSTGDFWRLADGSVINRDNVVNYAPGSAISGGSIDSAPTTSLVDYPSPGPSLVDYPSPGPQKLTSYPTTNPDFIADLKADLDAGRYPIVELPRSAAGNKVYGEVRGVELDESNKHWNYITRPYGVTRSTSAVTFSSKILKKSVATSLSYSSFATKSSALRFQDKPEKDKPATPPQGGIFGQTINIGTSASQSALQGATSGLGQTVSSFVGGVGQVSQAGLEICKVAELLMNIHTKMAEALTRHQQFKLCIDLSLNRLGNGDCNGGDPDNPQQAISAADSCVSALVSCNTHLEQMSSSLNGLGNFVDQKTQDFAKKGGALQGGRVGFGITAFDGTVGKEGREYPNTREVCAQDQVRISMDPGTPLICGPGWDIKVKKTQASVGGSSNQIRDATSKIDVSISGLKGIAPQLLGGNNYQANQPADQLKRTQTFITNFLSDIRSRAVVLKDVGKSNAAIATAAGELVVLVEPIIPTVDTSLTYRGLTDAIDQMEIQLARIKAATSPEALQTGESSLRGDSGIVNPTYQNAGSIFNAGAGIYTFILNCPKAGGTAANQFQVNFEELPCDGVKSHRGLATTRSVTPGGIVQGGPAPQKPEDLVKNAVVAEEQIKLGSDITTDKSESSLFVPTNDLVRKYGLESIQILKVSEKVEKEDAILTVKALAAPEQSGVLRIFEVTTTEKFRGKIENAILTVNIPLDEADKAQRGGNIIKSAKIVDAKSDTAEIETESSSQEATKFILKTGPFSKIRTDTIFFILYGSPLAPAAPPPAAPFQKLTFTFSEKNSKVNVASDALSAKYNFQFRSWAVEKKTYNVYIESNIDNSYSVLVWDQKRQVYQIVAYSKPGDPNGVILIYPDGKTQTITEKTNINLEVTDIAIKASEDTANVLKDGNLPHQVPPPQK